MSIWFERFAIILASLVLSIGLIALLSGFFAGRDQAGISGSQSSIGERFRDLGGAHLAPGQPHPVYDSDPPTSGAHAAVPITADETRLSDDQLLQALQAGDVVIMYGGHTPPPGLRELARQSGSFTPSLAAAGQAVVLARRHGTVGLIALAWTRMARVSAPDDSLLHEFIQQWLGHGASGR